jgi:hypothetical protein
MTVRIERFVRSDFQISEDSEKATGPRFSRDELVARIGEDEVRSLEYEIGDRLSAIWAKKHQLEDDLREAMMVWGLEPHEVAHLAGVHPHKIDEMLDVDLPRQKLMRPIVAVCNILWLDWILIGNRKVEVKYPYAF